MAPLETNNRIFRLLNYTTTVFGKKATSPMTCGTLAKKSSGMSIAFQKQGLSLRGFGKNGSPRTSQAKQHKEVVEQQSTVTTIHYQWKQDL